MGRRLCSEFKWFSGVPPQADQASGDYLIKLLEIKGKCHFTSTKWHVFPV
jgi:hypothetical protein